MDLLIGEGKPWHKYADELVDTLEMFQFMQFWGWKHPDDFRELDAQDYQLMRAYMQGVEEAQEWSEKNNNGSTKSTNKSQYKR